MINLEPSVKKIIEAISTEIDTILEQDSKLQQFLSIIEQKVNAIDLGCTDASVRAFYFSFPYKRDISLSIALDENILNFLALSKDLNLDSHLNRTLNDGLSLSKDYQKKN